VSRTARLFVGLTLVAICISSLAATAFTATITVSGGTVYSKSHTIAIGELVPSGCSSIAGVLGAIENAATNTVIWGSGNNTIWLWNSKNQTTGAGGANLAGGNGSDCMVPGGVRAGATLQVGGGTGTDYCYGGPGPGAYTANSCNNAGLLGTPYNTVTTSNPAFA
jgi:hypothetical protein